MIALLQLAVSLAVACGGYSAELPPHETLSIACESAHRLVVAVERPGRVALICVHADSGVPDGAYVVVEPGVRTVSTQIMRDGRRDGYARFQGGAGVFLQGSYARDVPTGEWVVSIIGLGHRRFDAAMAPVLMTTLRLFDGLAATGLINPRGA